LAPFTSWKLKRNLNKTRKLRKPADLLKKYEEIKLTFLELEKRKDKTSEYYRGCKDALEWLMI